MDAALYLAAFTCLGFFIATLDIAVGMRRIPFLRAMSPDLPAAAPKVSIVIPARNEEAKIREALQSVLNQTYPAFEVIAIDDRSTDATGKILDQMAQRHKTLCVRHIDHLPGGWLGKNHALQIATQNASGDLILFTDADIVMRPDALARAVAHLETRRIDHLTVCPEMRLKGTLLPMFASFFFLYLFFYLKPWKATDFRSKRYVGIGAFNLVRASVYRAIGAHEKLKLQVVDDLMLGKCIKRAGFRQALLFGTGMVSVAWYASLSDMVHGLEKNMFAGLKFRIWFCLLGIAGNLAFVLWPYAAVFLIPGPTRWFNLAAIGLMLWHYQDAAAFSNQKRWHAVAYPFLSALLGFVQLRSMYRTLKRNGIVWRDTPYPLAELKRHAM